MTEPRHHISPCDMADEVSRRPDVLCGIVLLQYHEGMDLQPLETVR